jgi:glycosyltransferase involved in cell wall biosynthesis
VHSFYGEHADARVERVMAPNVREAVALLAVSRSTAEQAAALGADPSRMRVIRSGVDTRQFRPRPRAEARQRLGVPTSLPLVLFVGNLEPRKAVDHLLLALRDVRRSAPSATLAVLGSGESAGADNQEPRLRAMVGELGLGDAVQFQGRVSDTALLDWYAAADVFALPSSSEAQGIVALEAMASGLPVVASAVGGLLDTVDDGVTGYLVPFGDVDALAGRISSLLGDAALRARMGEAARVAVEGAFSWEQSVQATMDLYRDVLAAWT